MTLEIFFVSITFSVAGKSETVEMIRKKKKKKEHLDSLRLYDF